MPTPHRVGVWWLRSPGADVVTAHGFAGEAYPDGAVVDALPVGRGADGERVARARMRVDTRQLTELLVLGPQVDAAPGLVYAECVDRSCTPTAVDLVAFLGDDAAGRAVAAGVGEPVVGAVLTAGDVQRLGFTGVEQVAAVRWVPGTGEVLEIYVDPGLRRRRIATAMLIAAEAGCVARAWPRLSGGGVRTAMGEALTRSLPWGHLRAAPLTQVAPPTTGCGRG